VDTRVRKLREQNLDAIVLAAAGINRLEIQGVGIQPLDPTICLPAPGQGILGLEVREGDERTAALIAPLNDANACACAVAERAVLAALGGGCQVPIGVLAEMAEGFDLAGGAATVRLRAVVASIDGARMVRADMTGPAADAANLGLQAADRLREAGADEILRSCGVLPSAPS
jgi:hydroxymethylbilane synthase